MTKPGSAPAVVAAGTEGMWRDLAIVSLLGLGIFLFESLAWPVAGGRDINVHLGFFNHYWQSNPDSWALMVFRTPMAPWFLGGISLLGGPQFMQVVTTLMFIGAVAAVYYIGRIWSRQVALIAAVAVAGFPPYAVLFHRIASDGLFAFGFIAWAAYIVRTARAPTLGQFAWHGVIVFLLILTRPSAQIFLAFAAFPLLLNGFDARRKLAAAGLFLATSLALTAAWATHNAIRYDDFTISRAGNAHLPFWRVFVLDRIVSADNGPASARLAKAVEDDLLRREPYRSLGLDVDTVMGSGDSRVWSDLVSLSDRTWGWDADLAVLRAAGFEAIRAHPLRYLHGVASTWKTAFRNNLTPGPTQVSTDRRRGPEELATFRPHGQRVIPFSFQDYRGSRPGGPSHDQPRDEPQVGWWSVPYGTLHGSVRDGSPGVARFLNDVVTDLYPPMYVFVLLGFAGVFLCPHPARWVMLFIAGLALGHVLIVYAIEHVVLEYRTAFDAVFILLGVAGFTRNGLGYRLRREAG